MLLNTWKPFFFTKILMLFLYANKGFQKQDQTWIFWHYTELKSDDNITSVQAASKSSDFTGWMVMKIAF